MTDSSSAFSQFELAFLGPYPHKDQVKEGWMSRVFSIDRAFQDRNRVYAHIDTQIYGDQQRLVPIDAKSAVFYLNPLTDEGRDYLAQLIDTVDACYCHTLHLAEYLIDFLGSGKICVDVHGITPEEESLMGNEENVARYELVEQRVLSDAKLCVFVTNAMHTHYQSKYPRLSPNWTKVGIFEKYEAQPSGSDYFLEAADLPIEVIYAGGTQAWQNIEAMTACVEPMADWANFRFYSHEHEKITSTLGKQDSKNVKTGFCEKALLVNEYNSSDFGFIVRSESPVNRVACPTKMIEYLCYGVIPIVDSVEIGDFAEYGYEYVTLEDFKQGMFPDRTSRAWMAKRNLQVARTMQEEFDQALMDLPAKVLN